MKRMMLLAVMAIMFLGLNAQTVKKDTNGNFVLVSTAVKDSADVKAGLFTDKKGVKHQVYQGPKGGYYYLGTDKYGKKVKRYLTIK